MITIKNKTNIVKEINDEKDFFDYLIQDKTDFKNYDTIKKIFFNYEIFYKQDYIFTVKEKNKMYVLFLFKYKINLCLSKCLNDKKYKGYYFIRGYTFDECQLKETDKKFPLFIDYWLDKKCTNDCAVKNAKLFFDNNIITELYSITHWNILFWTSRGYTEEDANKQIVSLQKNNVNKLSLLKKEFPENYNDMYLSQPNYWINKHGLSLKEAEEKVRSNQQTFSLDICIKKFGEIEGRKRWETRQNKWQTTLQSNPDIHNINKSKDSSSLNWALKKCNGNIEEAIIFRHNANKNKASGNIEWALKKCNGNIEEATIFLQNHLDKIILSRTSPYSKESIKFLTPLYDFCISLGIETSQLYWKENEFFLSKKTKGFYCYDFTIRNLKLIIEYHGIAFHPKTPTSNWKSIFTNETAQEVYERDQHKKQIAIDNGFEFYEVWGDNTTNFIENVKIIILDKWRNYCV